MSTSDGSGIDFPSGLLFYLFIFLFIIEKIFEIYFIFHPCHSAVVAQWSLVRILAGVVNIMYKNRHQCS